MRVKLFTARIIVSLGLLGGLTLTGCSTAPQPAVSEPSTAVQGKHLVGEGWISQPQLDGKGADILQPLFKALDDTKQNPPTRRPIGQDPHETIRDHRYLEPVLTAGYLHAWANPKLPGVTVFTQSNGEPAKDTQLLLMKVTLGNTNANLAAYVSPSVKLAAQLPGLAQAIRKSSSRLGAVVEVGSSANDHSAAANGFTGYTGQQ